MTKEAKIIAGINLVLVLIIAVFSVKTDRMYYFFPFAMCLVGLVGLQLLVALFTHLAGAHKWGKGLILGALVGTVVGFSSCLGVGYVIN